MFVNPKDVDGASRVDLGELVSIANAAAALGDKIAAARADRLLQLERSLMFDPDPAYRAEAKREYLALTERGE